MKGNSRSYIRMIAGGYLIYMSIQMIQEVRGETPPSNPLIVLLFAIAFILAGGSIIVLELWRMKKEKDARNADTQEENSREGEEEKKETKADEK